MKKSSLMSMVAAAAVVVGCVACTPCAQAAAPDPGAPEALVVSTTSPVMPAQVGDDRGNPQSGDQTGTKIFLTTYWDDGWRYVSRNTG
ncbi:MAG: hypothetical protein FWF25_06870 [Propionibacteriaceae bacterium]|nr:hypothetical protein [Propionibacteriaceae bacterium]